MVWILATILLVAMAFCFFWWAKYQTKKAHAAFTKADVISAIENVLSPDYHDEWDSFLAWPIGDSCLESVRQRCIAISGAHSGTEKGKDIGSAGEAQLLLILNELKASI
jgi:hypothetical protein